MKKLLFILLGMLASALTLPLALSAQSKESSPAPKVSEEQTEAFLFSALPETAPAQTSVQTSHTQTTPASAEETTQAPPPQNSDTLLVMIDGAETEMELEELVCLATAAEMPALFPKEALKAQAIAVRTYVAYRLSHPVAAHPDCAVCNDPGHCLAIANKDELFASWGENGEEWYSNITCAAAETKGQILLYEGEPILAVFHSASANQTASALEVWGGDYDYLVSVPSPDGESEAPVWESEVFVEKKAFAAAFSSLYPEADLSGARWFSEARLSESGYVDRVCVGGVWAEGSEIRNLCGLKSTCFSVEEGTELIRFLVHGYGHGVGMSQYGARALALEGRNAKEILAHYYRGAILTETADVNIYR